MLSNPTEILREQAERSLRAVSQDFGDAPNAAIRETDHYQAEYVQTFVEKWDELIDWGSRAESEGRFFIEQLKARGKMKVLDVATGTGFHSIQLADAGFEVTSVDGNAAMLAKGFPERDRPAPDPQDDPRRLALAEPRGPREVRCDHLPGKLVHAPLRRAGPPTGAGRVLRRIEARRHPDPRPAQLRLDPRPRLLVKAQVLLLRG